MEQEKLQVAWDDANNRDLSDNSAMRDLLRYFIYIISPLSTPRLCEQYAKIPIASVVDILNRSIFDNMWRE